jgi:hypothetical protein
MSGVYQIDTKKRVSVVTSQIAEKILCKNARRSTSERTPGGAIFFAPFLSNLIPVSQESFSQFYL